MKPVLYESTSHNNKIIKLTFNKNIVDQTIRLRCANKNSSTMIIDNNDKLNKLTNTNRFSIISNNSFSNFIVLTILVCFCSLALVPSVYSLDQSGKF